MAEEKTIYLGAKLRKPFPLPHQIIGYALSTIPSCFEVWGIKDPEIELSRLREERDEAMKAYQEADQERIRMRNQAMRGRRLAEHIIQGVSEEVLLAKARKFMDHCKSI